jgi:hypothetical protein
MGRVFWLQALSSRAEQTRTNERFMFLRLTKIYSDASADTRQSLPLSRRIELGILQALLTVEDTCFFKNDTQNIFFLDPEI